MKDYSYNFEVKDLLTQFIAAFDDVVIKRYDKDRIPKEEIKVRYVVGPKQRVMYDIVNKAHNLTLPVVALNITSISRDPNRVFNKLDSIYYPGAFETGTSTLMPVPINVEISMSILARYMQDLDQIISNFVPYNNPYIIISWKEPNPIPDKVIEIRSEVLWSGNISLTEPTDMSYSEKMRLIADTSFTIKGWLFKNKASLSSPIYYINTNFINVRKDAIVTETQYDSFFNSLSSSTETISISGTPKITNAYFTVNGATSEIKSNFVINSQSIKTGSILLYGKNFSHTTSILLSTNPFGTFANPLTSVTSKRMGTLQGHILDPSSYTILNENNIIISLSGISGYGELNFAVANPAGWDTTFSINNFIFDRR